MRDNRNLESAKKRKCDEFYTLMEDIEKEVMHYADQFRGKTVYCNCDDPDHSNFFKFFVKHFERLGIKKVIATGMSIDGGPAHKSEFSGSSVIRTPLKGNGDFRSEECLKILGGGGHRCDESTIFTAGRICTYGCGISQRFCDYRDDRLVKIQSHFPAYSSWASQMRI